LNITTTFPKGTNASSLTPAIRYSDKATSCYLLGLVVVTVFFIFTIVTISL
jgi:hypothetical protein